MQQNNTVEPQSDNSDVVASIVIITTSILVAIHFIQTGGLPAFFSRLF